MAKKIKCKVRLHGMTREIIAGPFESIAEAKEQTRFWFRPKTIVRETESLYHKI